MPLEVKNWIRHVLLNSSMGKAPLDSKESETFLNKLLLTRGQRQANDASRLLATSKQTNKFHKIYIKHNTYKYINSATESETYKQNQSLS